MKKKALPPSEEKYVRLDGSVVDVEVNSTPFTTSGGHETQVLFQDITARKRAEAEREMLISDLEIKTLKLKRCVKAWPASWHLRIHRDHPTGPRPDQTRHPI